MVFDNLETLQPRFDASYSGGDFVESPSKVNFWALWPRRSLWPIKW